jgi:hypothetical protein
MTIETQKFLARNRADVDWQQEGSNINPYSAKHQPEAYTAYNNRFEQVSTEWAAFTGSAA